MRGFLVGSLVLFGSHLCGFTGLPTPNPNPPPLQNLTLAGPNGNIQLAVSTNSRSIAVWTNWPNQGAKLQAAYYTGTNWIRLNNNTNTMLPIEISTFFFVNVDPNSGTFANGSSPRVGVDVDGNPTIVWVSPNAQIVAARYRFNTATNTCDLTSLTILSDTGTANTSPVLAVNQQGVAVVVWIRSSSYRVLAKSFTPPLGEPPGTPGGEWGPEVTFMPIPPPGLDELVNPFREINNIPANTVGTYPAGLGLSNLDTSKNGKGVMVWIDGPTGTVHSGIFSIP